MFLQYGLLYLVLARPKFAMSPRQVAMVPHLPLSTKMPLQSSKDTLVFFLFNTFTVIYINQTQIQILLHTVQVLPTISAFMEWFLDACASSKKNFFYILFNFSLQIQMPNPQQKKSQVSSVCKSANFEIWFCKTNPLIFWVF